MPEKQVTSSGPSATSENLKKKRNSSGVAVEPIRAVSDAAATFLSEGAESVAKSLQSFRKELEPENVSRVGFTSAWITGILEAYASLFDEMAAVSRRLVDETRNAPEANLRATIDYERLARMVANELRKQKTDETA
jgi:hypothetical protein